MATYTTRNGLIKPATNEFVNTWGTEFNAGFSDLVDFALDGWTSLAISGANVTLTDEDGDTDQSRARVIYISSSDQARTITIPAVEKFYKVYNASSYTITITISGGASTEVLAGQSADVITNGTIIRRDNVSGWGTFSTTNLTSGTSINIDIDPNQHFSQARLIFSNVSAGSTDTLSVTLRTDGGTTQIGSLSIAAVLSNAANGVYGSLDIPAYRNTNGTFSSITGNSGSLASPGVLLCAAYQGFWQGGSVGRLSMYWSSGGSFDGSGTATLQLR